MKDLTTENLQALLKGDDLTDFQIVNAKSEYSNLLLTIDALKNKIKELEIKDK